MFPVCLTSSAERTDQVAGIPEICLKYLKKRNIVAEERQEQRGLAQSKGSSFLRNQAAGRSLYSEYRVRASSMEFDF
jgi:L-lactate utilization protein LutC